MGLAEDIQRVRMRARGAEINRRHRAAREKAQRMAGAMGQTSSADGVHPDFHRTLEAARKQAKAATEAAAASRLDPSERIEQLVREGKLPPRPDHGVGYEPTPEEILGDLSEASAPDGTEDLPDAAAVLSGDPEPSARTWGEAPAPAAPPAPALAQAPQNVQPKRKRRQ